MRHARQLLREAVLATVVAIALIVELAIIDPALAAVIGIMLIGLLVAIAPIVSVL